MTKYTMICAAGHEPEELSVEADNDEEAMKMMMSKAREHNSQKHPGMEMSNEEMKDFIRSHWTK